MFRDHSLNMRFSIVFLQHFLIAIFLFLSHCTYFLTHCYIVSKFSPKFCPQINKRVWTLYFFFSPHLCWFGIFKCVERPVLFASQYPMKTVFASQFKSNLTWMIVFIGKKNNLTWMWSEKSKSTSNGSKVLLVQSKCCFWTFQ